MNARDLHAYLGIGKNFGNWIVDRIAQYGFVENKDFIILTKVGKYSGPGQPRKEYAVSLEMAKHLAMMENNQKGYDIRQYCINFEP